ncbi:MAG: undecaprenyldiphospho-muramoylpentapeptide beta-N-acetylglucosaminyltransferase [Candidatus Hydrogenedentes bacterium]|nr:undecaprenyldiphospho-muramoylpentapeptide beta-N-acetylglucosaminyltransferase [Candidatus Hydrogenedentota bacterium]
MRIMVAGGGTGGHTSPAVAVIEELQQRDPRLDLVWVGRKGGIEERVCRSLSLPFRPIPVEGWPRRRTPRKAWAAAKLAWSILRCRRYIRRFRPQAVFGVGGYVSLPLLWAAQRKGIPTVLHEQNRLLGMANRMLAPRATRILLSFEDTVGSFPEEAARVVGNPVRAGFRHPPAYAEARARFELRPDVPVVLVCGGSQGARTLNAAMQDVIRALGEDEAQFIWMTGQAAAEEARRAAEGAAACTRVFAYIDDMVGACAAADLIVSRAGASSTAEIAVLGKPSVLVPFPFATDNHQEQNAQAFVDAGAARMLLDADCSGDALADAVRDLLGDSARLGAMGEAARSLAKPDAAEAIAEEVLSLVFEAGAS